MPLTAVPLDLTSLLLVITTTPVAVVASVVAVAVAAVVASVAVVAVVASVTVVAVVAAVVSVTVVAVVAVAVALSCLFFYLPALSGVSTGVAVIVCTVVGAGFGAYFFPNKGW